MDNQQDQFGTPNANSGRASSNADSTGASATSGRKTGAASSAQSGSSAANASSQPTASAGASRQGEGQQANEEGNVLDSALNSGKKWIEDSGVLDGVNQLPQTLKDFGNRALDRVNGLSTTQKVVGGALLAAGIGWLATRKSKSSSASDSGSYNYGRQRDAGSYGRRSYGYQAPDASTSRRSAAGSGRTDSGAAYGSSGSRYGSSGYGRSESHPSNSTSGNTGILSGSGRDNLSTYGSSSASHDHGSQHASGGSYRSSEDNFGDVE